MAWKRLTRGTVVYFVGRFLKSHGLFHRSFFKCRLVFNPLSPHGAVTPSLPP
jgi:hypothetical protein